MFYVFSIFSMFHNQLFTYCLRFAETALDAVKSLCGAVFTGNPMRLNDVFLSLSVSFAIHSHL